MSGDPNDNIRAGQTPDDAIGPFLDGIADPAAVRRFEERLRSEPAALEAYLQQMRMHALLQWRYGQANVGGPVRLPQAIPRPSPWRLRSAGRLAAAAVLVIGATLAAFVAPRFFHAKPSPAPSLLAIAELVESHDAVWANGQAPLARGARVPHGPVALQSGSIRLHFDSGAWATISGPARLDLVDAMKVRVTQGQLTVNVEPAAHGFTVETPDAKVVDLGTEFGVQIQPAGVTDVVVFKGKVDVSSSHDSAQKPARELSEGEATRLDVSGGFKRIVAVERGADDLWSTGDAGGSAAVIRSVRDDLRDPASGKFYRIVPGGLADGARAYVDRAYSWHALDGGPLPELLAGADLLMTFNDDKHADLEMTVTLAKPANLYVFYDGRFPPPSWLVAGFVDTAQKLRVEGPQEPSKTAKPGSPPPPPVDRLFSVWMCRVDQPGAVTLGHNEGKFMYAVAAK